MTLNTIFNIGQTVWIDDIKAKGKVIGIYVGRHVMQLNVRWFKDGEPKTAYFTADEVTIENSKGST